MSVAVTLVILIVFGTLFASADAAFSQVLDNLVPEVNAGTGITWIFLFVVGLLTMTAAVYTVAAPRICPEWILPARGGWDGSSGASRSRRWSCCSRASSRCR